METYIEQFKEIVLKHLGKSAKKFAMQVHHTALGFYLGWLDANDHDMGLGIGYMNTISMPNCTNIFVVTMNYEGQACYLEAIKKEGGGFDYEWTFEDSNIATYHSRTICLDVIKALKLEGAEPLLIGDSQDFDLWRSGFPNSKVTVKEELVYKQLEYPTIKDIVNLKLDMFKKGEKFQGIIHTALMYISETYEIDQDKTRVYAVTNVSGDDLSLYIFNAVTYVDTISLTDLVLAAFGMAQDAHEAQQEEGEEV